MAYQNIEDVALRARRAFETRTVDLVLLRELYGIYAKVDDMDSFLDQAAILFPAGNCGLASVYLQHELQAGEVMSGNYSGERHTFLYLVIWLLILLQTSLGRPIYIGKLCSPWSKGNAYL